MFIYLSKEKAKKGISLTIATSDAKINNFIELYGDDVIEYEATSIPQFVTYDENNNTIREATELEKVERGQLILDENQVLIDNHILTYDKDYQKIMDGKIVNKSLKELIDENVITLEDAKHQKRRVFRQILLDKLYADFDYNGKVFQMGESDESNFLRVKSAIDIATTSTDNRAIIGAIKSLKGDISAEFENNIKLIMKDKSKLSEFIQSLKINWRLKDNSVSQFTFGEINNVYLLWILRGTSVQEEYTAIAEKVMSCKTVEDLEKIEWD